MTNDMEHTAANQQRLLAAQAAWVALLSCGLQRGFFGTLRLELSIQDGTIQHVRRQLEQLEK